MARSRTALKTDALERARAARLHLDAERESRDRSIETAAAAYFTADDKRADLLEQIRAVEAEMGAGVEALRSLGEPTGRIAQLLGIDLKDVRRYQSAASSDDHAGGEQSEAVAVPLPSPAA